MCKVRNSKNTEKRVEYIVLFVISIGATIKDCPYKNGCSDEHFCATKTFASKTVILAAHEPIVPPF
ncbi:hypothetical protein PN36_06915 [Candidatus Thiomargarita nelsonii]|uniref:Uncharacterized protein n=1 Tax=Candidatus Thiomargarita nelsonii TaxID=1003181 RepID=A0A0A6P649_9GAMM|nr:hypothetical protein PN36_06915 [Candidatus Thiomargarita nelsonii]